MPKPLTKSLRIIIIGDNNPVDISLIKTFAEKGIVVKIKNKIRNENMLNGIKPNKENKNASKAIPVKAILKYTVLGVYECLMNFSLKSLYKKTLQ